jgi:hypothetical protein
MNRHMLTRNHTMFSFEFFSKYALCDNNNILYLYRSELQFLERMMLH